MTTRSDVLVWAQGVVKRKAAPAHQLLEIAADASLDDAQEAFHKIARVAHPDLHRATLAADELELVTTAYARAAAAHGSVITPSPSAARRHAVAVFLQAMMREWQVNVVTNMSGYEPI